MIKDLTKMTQIGLKLYEKVLEKGISFNRLSLLSGVSIYKINLVIHDKRKSKRVWKEIEPIITKILGPINDEFLFIDDESTKCRLDIYSHKLDKINIEFDFSY